MHNVSTFWGTERKTQRGAWAFEQYFYLGRVLGEANFSVFSLFWTTDLNSGVLLGYSLKKHKGISRSVCTTLIWTWGKVFKFTLLSPSPALGVTMCRVQVTLRAGRETEDPLPITCLGTLRLRASVWEAGEGVSSYPPGHRLVAEIDGWLIVDRCLYVGVLTFLV